MGLIWYESRFLAVVWMDGEMRQVKWGQDKIN
jgi:hypothetical protein